MQGRALGTDADGIDSEGGLQDYVDKLATIPLEFSPGESWNYSVATDVLGYLVEKISGQPFEAFLKARIDGNLAILDKRLAGRSWILGERPTIADISLCAYLYYPADEFGFDIAATHKNIGAWLERMKVLPGWKHPYDLMPGYPFGTQGYRHR